jgi:ribosomal protein L12E/L44/L45/RPP1/RPP2
MTDMGVKAHACHTRSTKTPRKGHGMSVDKEEISRTVLELDKEFNERWSDGDFAAATAATSTRRSSSCAKATRAKEDADRAGAEQTARKDAADLADGVRFSIDALNRADTMAVRADLLRVGGIGGLSFSAS